MIGIYLKIREYVEDTQELILVLGKVRSGWVMKDMLFGFPNLASYKPRTHIERPTIFTDMNTRDHESIYRSFDFF